MALFYQVFSQGQRLLQTLLRHVGDIYRNILFLENLFEFLELQPRIVSPPRPASARGSGFQGSPFTTQQQMAAADPDPG